MKTFLLVKIILWGLLLLALVIAFIHVYIKEEDSLSVVSTFILIILAGYLPACFFYYDLIRYCSTPNPTNQTEVSMNGITYIQYEDNHYFCNCKENSTVFTSLLLPDSKPSQMDSCIICHQPFLRHQTRDENSFFQSIIEANEGTMYVSTIGEMTGH